MRLLPIALLVFQLLGFAGAQEEGILDPDGNQYFPKEHQLGYTALFGVAKHLAALKEPSLAALRAKDEVDVFRFTWVPTNEKTICFRAYAVPNEGYFIDVKRLSGAGGYFIGEVELSAHVRISENEFRSMRELAKKDAVRSPFSDLSAEAADYLASAGDAWIVEILTGGNYYLAHIGDPRFLQTVTPENAKKAGNTTFGEPIEIPDLDLFIRFCEQFLVFTDMNLPKRHVSDMDWIFEAGDSPEPAPNQ